MPQGKRRSTRQSSRSNKRQGGDSQVQTPKRQRRATTRAKKAEAAVCSSPFDALPDEILTLVVSFGGTLELRSLWFVSRRLRTLQITADELLWRPHANATVSPLWKSAKWLSAREVWLAKHHVDRVTLDLLKPVICSECQECVPAVLTLTEGRTTPSCILCVKAASVVRENDADDLFRQLSSAQLAKLPHRMVCPNRCIEFDHHNPEFQGHERVFFVKDLRRAASSECVLTAADIPGYTRKHFEGMRPTGESEFLDVIKTVRIGAQVELGKRYGLTVKRSQLPFPDETGLFKHMAQEFRCKLSSQLAVNEMGRHPRQLMRWAIQESITTQELRLITEPDKQCCSVKLPPVLDDLLVSISRDTFVKWFVESVTVRQYYELNPEKRFKSVFKKFHATALETDAWYFLRSLKEVGAEFVCYILEEDTFVADDNTDDDNGDQLSAPLSEVERAFVKLHVGNAPGYLMESMEKYLRHVAVRRLVNEWNTGMNGKRFSRFLSAVKLYSERLAPHIRLEYCYRTALQEIDSLLRRIPRRTRSQSPDRGLDMVQLAVKIHWFERSIQNFHCSPLGEAYVRMVSKTVNKTCIASLATEALAMLSSLCEASVKSARTRRWLLKEYGGRKNLGETISNGILETFEAKAMSLVKAKQREEERAAAAAIFMSCEEMEDAGIVALGPVYECDRCGDDHRESDCDVSEYYSEEEDMFW